MLNSRNYRKNLPGGTEGYKEKDSDSRWTFEPINSKILTRSLLTRSRRSFCGCKRFIYPVQMPTSSYAFDQGRSVNCTSSNVFTSQPFAHGVQNEGITMRSSVPIYLLICIFHLRNRGMDLVVRKM